MQIINLKHYKALSVIILLHIFIFGVNAQYNSDIAKDSLSSGIPTIKYHSPQRAALYAAVVPGLGQIYNKSYWKLPLVYGGLGWMIYWTKKNQDIYLMFKKAYMIRTDGDPNTKIDPNLIFNNYNVDILKDDEILRNREIGRQNRDYSVIAIAAIYVASIIDATVDGYLYNYDISNDIALNIKPEIKLLNKSQICSNITLKLRF